jgi:hypothetical protein
MRKFQYVVTIDVDDDHFLSEDAGLVEEIKKLDGISGPDLVYALADARFPAAMEDILNRNMGDAGKTKVKATFAGEVK